LQATYPADHCKMECGTVKNIACRLWEQATKPLKLANSARTHGKCIAQPLWNYHMQVY